MRTIFERGVDGNAPADVSPCSMALVDSKEEDLIVASDQLGLSWPDEE